MGVDKQSPKSLATALSVHSHFDAGPEALVRQRQMGFERERLF